jgi:hypothetical protein
MSRGSALGANTAARVVRGAGVTVVLVLNDAERGLGTGGKSNDARKGVETGSEYFLDMGVGGGMAVAAVLSGVGGRGTF